MILARYGIDSKVDAVGVTIGIPFFQVADVRSKTQSNFIRGWYYQASAVRFDRRR
jgi:hypothetical protein